MARLSRRDAIFCATVLAVGFAVGCAVKTPPPPIGSRPIELKPVTIAELDDEIASHKGKVVLIDVWFLGCAPCVKKFPEFVELHRELASEGLVCISLNAYQEENKKRDKVLAFLSEKQADTINLIINEPNSNRFEDWIDKYDCRATPSNVIFDRKGKRVVGPEPATKENMMKFLKKLLSESP